jgi:hypothetical protein
MAHHQLKLLLGNFMAAPSFFLLKGSAEKTDIMKLLF